MDPLGGGPKYESRVETVLAFYKYLCDRLGERASKSDLENLVEERDLNITYPSFRPFCENWVKKNKSQGRDFDALTQLLGVKMDGDDCVYTGGNSYSKSLGSKLSTSGILGYSVSVETIGSSSVWADPRWTPSNTFNESYCDRSLAAASNVSALSGIISIPKSVTS